VLPADGSFATVFHHLCMKIPGPVDAWYAELEKLTPDKRMACYVDSVEGTRFAYTDERHLCGLHIEYFWIGPELETMLGVDRVEQGIEILGVFAGDARESAECAVQSGGDGRANRPVSNDGPRERRELPVDIERRGFCRRNQLHAHPKQRGWHRRRRSGTAART